MGKAPIFLLIIILPLLSPECKAQSIFDVSQPRFEIIDNNVLIYFDILNSTPFEKFDINIEITDAEGKRITATALSGDIGENVSGGNNKLVTWDLKADNIVMNAEIIVNIYAKIILPQPTSPVANNIDNLRMTNEYNRAGLILQSLALPGLGLSRVTRKPHWIRGVAGYGCIAGAILLNKMAISSYDDFLDAETTEDSNSFMTKTIQQDNISELLAYAAIGIWITDFIWTVLGTRDMNNKLLSNDAKRISFTTGYNHMTTSPMVGIIFKF